MKTAVQLSSAGDKCLQMREFELRHNELREYVDVMVKHERDVRTVVWIAQEKALALQASEYSRRLEDLNHAHRTAMENWAQSLPREMFDQWKDEHSKWRDAVSTSITTLTPLGPAVHAISDRISGLETMANKITGALILLGVMGLSGVLALALGLARLAGVLK